jgi:DNA-binding protein H-NS
MPTLEVIQEKLKRLQAQADAMIAKKAQSVLNQVRGLMLEHGLTIEDIEEKAEAKQETKGTSSLDAGTRRKASSALGTKVPPKFQNPKTGATWTGRGSAPAWIAAVRDRTRFLIQSDAVAAHVTSDPEAKDVNATATEKTRRYRTGPQPAKYRDRKSGATWSGRGPAPAWLAKVKDRTKFLIDEEGASPDAGAEIKAAQKASAGAEAVSAFKKVTRNVAAKKATTKKATAVKREANEATPTRSVAASKEVAAKKTGPVLKKKVAKRATGSSTAANASTVADTDSNTRGELEGSAL